MVELINPIDKFVLTLKSDKFSYTPPFSIQTPRYTLEQVAFFVIHFTEFKRVKSAEEGILFYLNIITQLTATELDVLNLFVQGKGRMEICDIRNVELNTVKSQIHSIDEVVNILKEYKIFEVLRSSGKY